MSSRQRYALRLFTRTQWGVVSKEREREKGERGRGRRCGLRSWCGTTAHRGRPQPQRREREAWWRRLHHLLRCRCVNRFVSTAARSERKRCTGKGHSAAPKGEGGGKARQRGPIPLPTTVAPSSAQTAAWVWPWPAPLPESAFPGQRRGARRHACLSGTVPRTSPARTRTS